MPMTSAARFKIQSQLNLTSEWLPESAFSKTFSDLGSAVAAALEGVDDPEEQEVCVIDVETDQVVWRSTDETYE